MASAGHVFPALWAALGLFLLLCSLCTFCKHRKKRRIRKVCSGRGPVVDVSLLRQTQLRSLSKSDTKLHEIRRPHVGRHQFRPLSMDPGYPSTIWQPPPWSPPTEATYSNLTFPPNYQSESPEPSECRPAVSDAYACVQKVKRSGPLGSEKTPAHPVPADPCAGDSPQQLRIENMYSKVHRKKRPAGEGNKSGAPESIQGPTCRGMEPVMPLRVSETQPVENLYESICEMQSRTPGTRSNDDIITEL